MGRLKVAPARLATLAPRVTRPTDASGHSTVFEPWRSWYSLARWRRLRMEIFARDLFTCRRAECGQLVGDTSKLVADHIEPHRGDPALFWSSANLQTLCQSCHSQWKQAQEIAQRSPQGYSAGRAPGVGVMSRPAWFRRVRVPFTVVCGPPGAGKSTYVRANAGLDHLVVCFDQLAGKMFGRPGPERPQASLGGKEVGDVLRVRNALLGDLMRRNASELCSAAWLILTEPKAEHRTWWAETTGARVVVLATPAELCLSRIEADAAAGDERGSDARQQVNAWWRHYRPSRHDLTIADEGLRGGR